MFHLDRPFCYFSCLRQLAPLRPGQLSVGGSTRGQAVIAGLKALEEESRDSAVGGDPLFAEGGGGGGEHADTGAGLGRTSARHAGPAIEVGSKVDNFDW